MNIGCNPLTLQVRYPYFPKSIGGAHKDLYRHETIKLLAERVTCLRQHALLFWFWSISIRFFTLSNLFPFEGNRFVFFMFFWFNRFFGHFYIYLPGLFFLGFFPLERARFFATFFLAAFLDTFFFIAIFTPLILVFNVVNYDFFNTVAY